MRHCRKLSDSVAHLIESPGGCGCCGSDGDTSLSRKEHHMAQDPHEQANIRRAVFALGALLAIGAAMWLFRRAAGVPWTGFGTRTLWDWLQLLIIPVVLAVGAYLFNRAERRNELRI